jgi:parvulin-like peptidyl-prolyl isomerase
MARNPKQPIITKKHLARQQREQLQRRYIIIGSIVTIVLVFALIGYGILDQYYLQGIRPVATVNGENISNREFQAQTRYARQRLVSQAQQTVQFMQYFGSSPETAASFQNQLFQIQAQLNPETVGQNVIDQLVDDALIRQEAKKRGITVSQEDIDKALQEGFGYFPDGTPTPEPTLPVVPTSTLNPTQLALVRPTSTPSATPVITATEELTATAEITPTSQATATPSVEPSATPTLAPTATATPYTLEGYQAEYQKTVDEMKTTINFSEADLRYVVEMQIYRKKLMDDVLKELNVTPEQEQVWARHILVADEATAKTVIDRLNKGEDFAALAAELSTDTSNKDRGGDLGWFGRGVMDSAFEEAAFKLKIGEISQPVQTQFGWHVIQALGHETRALSDNEYQQYRQTEFQKWLADQREKATVVINDERWKASVPAEPTLPPEITQLLSQPAQQSPLVPQGQPTP